MNHKAHVQLETHTVEDTQRFGQLLGKWAKQSGEPLCIALIGDLGTGKTHLSQGLRLLYESSALLNISTL